MSKLKALLRGMFFLLPVEVVTPQYDLHVVIVDNQGDVRFRMHGVGEWHQKDTINHPDSYQELDIPIMERLLVSDRQFPGAKELLHYGESGICAQYGKWTGYLTFCNRTLNFLFGYIPEAIYWKGEDAA